MCGRVSGLAPTAAGASAAAECHVSWLYLVVSIYCCLPPHEAEQLPLFFPLYLSKIDAHCLPFVGAGDATAGKDKRAQSVDVLLVKYVCL